MIAILRLIAFLIILWLALGFIKDLWQKLRAVLHARNIRRGGQVAEMVRDPVCGAYVSVEHSVKGMKDGVEYHFCSSECSKKYL